MRKLSLFNEPRRREEREGRKKEGKEKEFKVDRHLLDKNNNIFWLLPDY